MLLRFECTQSDIVALVSLFLSTIARSGPLFVLGRFGRRLQVVNQQRCGEQYRRPKRHRVGRPSPTEQTGFVEPLTNRV